MSGYIGQAPVVQATQTRQSFTATANQTSFSTLGYQENHLDVFLNGVKLNAADYTATNNSDIVLAAGCAVNDILEMVAFGTFEVANQSFTGTTVINTLTVTNDGTGSNIDADQLDGQHGAYYTGYTDTQLAALVDSSPAALNTLNELAAALGDDANFSTTVTNSIATKLPLAGGALTGALTTNSTIDGRDVAADGVTADAALPKAGGALTGAVTTNSTFDGVDIATRDAVLTSTTTTANAALPKAGGALTGNLSTTGLIDINTASTGLPTLKFSHTNSGADNFQVGGGTPGVSNSGFTIRDLDASTNRLVIDSSGNVLVGTTSAFGSSGVTLGSNIVYSAGSSQNVANFQRYGSDGELIRLGKAGTTVGSIGTVSGQPYFAGATAGGIQISHLNSTNAVIVPVTAAGANSNATHDIGYSGKLFRNISISGDITVGGGVVFGPASASTVSSQTLDSYEEGTFTPTVSAGYNSPSYNIQVGRYTKVGNTVRAYFRVALASGTATSAGVVFSGLPYASVNHGSVYTAGTHYTNNAVSGGENSVLLVFPNNTTISLYYQAATGVGTITGATSGNGLDVLGQVVYEAA